MALAKFHFNRLILTLILGIRASEPPGAGEWLKRPGLIGLTILTCFRGGNLSCALVGEILYKFKQPVYKAKLDILNTNLLAWVHKSLLRPPRCIFNLTSRKMTFDQKKCWFLPVFSPKQHCELPWHKMFLQQYSRVCADLKMFLNYASVQFTWGILS